MGARRLAGTCDAHRAGGGKPDELLAVGTRKGLFLGRRRAGTWE
ncbi:exo-alpha-sialidase, partial [Streptomyces albidoflavus]